MQEIFSTTILTKSSEETQKWAKELPSFLKNEKALKINQISVPQLWLLSGDLGSGKTSFVKGLGKAYGIDSHKIQSPTFALMKDHQQFIHYDLYRLSHADALILEQIEEQLDAGKIILIEWSERCPELKMHPHIELSFSTKSLGRDLGSNERHITLHLYAPRS